MTYGLVESPRSLALDRIAQTVATVLEAKSVLISVVNAGAHPFMGEVGFTEDLAEDHELRLNAISWCNLSTVAPVLPRDKSDGSLIDTRSDAPTSEKRWSTISVPISSCEGNRIGAFCVVDTGSRGWSDREVSVVQAFAWLVSEHVALRSLSLNLESSMTAIAHDLRSPLNTISISAHMAKRHGGGSAAVMQAFDRIHLACGAMSRMLGGVLVRRESLDGEHLDLIPVPSGCLLGDAAAMLSPIAERAGIELIWHAAQPDVRINVDYGQILRVFANLVENAIKFSPSGSNIRMSSNLGDDGKVRFVVEDEGCGISSQDAPFVFDEHWKRDSDETRGHGLGLFISRKIVSRHGGCLNLIPADSGCRFEFTIPH